MGKTTDRDRQAEKHTDSHIDRQAYGQTDKNTFKVILKQR